MPRVKDFNLKAGDLQPYYRVKVRDSSGTVVSLAGASIVCTMVNAVTGEIKVHRSSAGISITDGANGEFEYRWQAADTDEAGSYHIEFEITPVSGGRYTVPSCEHPALVCIRASLDVETLSIGVADGFVILETTTEALA